MAKRELRHSDNGVFVGAGEIEDGQCFWGSSTCEDKFEFDRPGNPELKSDLLKIVKEEFLELLNQIALGAYIPGLF